TKCDSEHLKDRFFWSGTVRRIQMVATKDILEPSLEMLGLSPYKPGKAEDYMSAKMRTHFEKILNLLRKQIREEEDRTVYHMKEDLVNYADPNDRASQEEDFRLELRTRDRER